MAVTLRTKRRGDIGRNLAPRSVQPLVLLYGCALAALAMTACNAPDELREPNPQGQCCCMLGSKFVHVPPSGSVARCAKDEHANRFEGVDLDDLVDDRLVQPRVHIVDRAKIHGSQSRNRRLRGKPGAPLT